MAIAGKLTAEEPKTQTWGDENTKPMTPKPSNPDATPYSKTPHIGYQEWAGGKEIGRTPRADDWEMSRNYDSWGDKTPRNQEQGGPAEETKEENKASTGWGGTSSWTDVPSVPETN